MRIKYVCITAIKKNLLVWVRREAMKIVFPPFSSQISNEANEADVMTQGNGSISCPSLGLLLILILYRPTQYVGR